MHKIPNTRNVKKPTCLGSGLVALDVIFRAGSDEPEFLAGGSCCNVLTILSYLGWRSFPIARLGCDVEGDRIVEDMRMWGVQNLFIDRDSRTDSPRIIQRTYAGERPRHRFSLRCTHGRWLPHQKPFRLDSLKRIEGEIPPANVFYFDRATPSSLQIARHQKQLGALVVFEPPKILDDKNFRECLEISDIFKHCYDSELNDFLHASPLLEIQTRGESGLRYRTRMLSQSDWTSLPAFDVGGLVDAAGSGDWLTAGLIHALRHNNTWRDSTEEDLQGALDFGQCLAALNCLYSGARGLMYHIPSTRLDILVSKIMSGHTAKQALDGIQSRTRHRNGLSPKCRICLCR